jgi:hypothetical protein
MILGGAGLTEIVLSRLSKIIPRLFGVSGQLGRGQFLNGSVIVVSESSPAEL